MRPLQAALCTTFLFFCSCFPGQGAQRGTTVAQADSGEGLSVINIAVTGELAGRDELTLEVRFQATGRAKTALKVVIENEHGQARTQVILPAAIDEYRFVGRTRRTEMGLVEVGLYRITIRDGEEVLAEVRPRVRSLPCFGFRRPYVDATPEISRSEVRGPFFIPSDERRIVTVRWSQGDETIKETTRDYPANSYPVTRSGTGQVRNHCPWRQQSIRVPNSLPGTGQVIVEVEISGMPGWRMTFPPGVTGGFYDPPVTALRVEGLRPGRRVSQPEDGNQESPVPPFAHEIRALALNPAAFELRSRINAAIYEPPDSAVVDARPGQTEHERVVRERAIDARITRDRGRLMGSRARQAAPLVRQLRAMVRRAGRAPWPTSEQPAPDPSL